MGLQWKKVICNEIDFHYELIGTNFSIYSRSDAHGYPIDGCWAVINPDIFISNSYTPQFKSVKDAKSYVENFLNNKPKYTDLSESK